MKLSELSPTSQATVLKIAKKKNVKPIEVLRHIDAISSRRRVSKHSKLFV